MSTPVLQVDQLQVSFGHGDSRLVAVDEVSFELNAGKTLCLVGESGCGKSVTSLALMGLLPQPAGTITNGRVLLGGEDLVGVSPERMYRIRGREMAMIFQEPMTALNPVHRIGKQLDEILRIHGVLGDERSRRSRALELLEEVGIPSPETRLRDFPHQLSGGMRQRVMIALALACKPKVLIADEPTTALDVTIQAQILELMNELKRRYQMAILFITHDLGVVAQMADDVIVMYGGRICEHGPVDELFHHPRHPYTMGLLRSIPRLETKPKSILQTIPGMVPPLSEMPDACRFEGRCDFSGPLCKEVSPTFEQAGTGHMVRCHNWQTVRELGAGYDD